jgi:hypothetical protein
MAAEPDPQRLQRVADAIEDPCDEGGYDPWCRNARGELCPFHQEHFRPPDYPCLRLLRIDLARRFIDEINARRRG